MDHLLSTEYITFKVITQILMLLKDIYRSRIRSHHGFVRLANIISSFESSTL